MPRAQKGKQEHPAANSNPAMPRKVQRDDEWGGFVQVNVDAAHREGFDKWAQEMGQDVYRELDDALGTGLKLTLSYDGANQCYIASLTGRPDVAGVRAFTCCLSAREGTFANALALLMYKHVALLHCDWWDVVNEPKRFRNSFG